MIRERDDAVSTFVRSVETPVHRNTFVKDAFWGEVGRQVAHLIGVDKARQLADIIQRDPVKLALYHKSEQTRVDLILYLQRTGRL